MRIDTEILMDKYKDNIYAAAFHICKSTADADDVVQDTFIKYHTMNKEFESEEHIKAWLLRVAINRAKNVITAFWRRQNVPLENYIETLAFDTPDIGNLFEEVMKLPRKYRIVIHLFYYEDYSVREIADILNLTESNVKVRLNRGRKLLKNALKEEWNDDDE